MMYLTLSRSILAIVVAILALGVLPIYGEPFGGCTGAEVGRAIRHCSNWPNYFRGFLFVALLLALGPPSRLYQTICTGLFIFVVIRGGPELIRTGEEFNFTSITEIIWQAEHGTEFFVGGLVGALSVVLFQMAWKAYGSNGQHMHCG